MILFTCFSESVVLATTVYLAVGGQWNYGVGITGSYSDYMHGQKIHTATVSHPEATPSMARAPALTAPQNADKVPIPVLI